MSTPIQKLWEVANFKPTPRQSEAILHVDGPLFLTAGPGSGKTRVLLWRTLNLIVYHNIPPDQIFLSTFTEKAAHQLREGLRTLLSIESNISGRRYDLAKMSIGTVHSICQKILTDRRFSIDLQRPRAPEVLDELDQYFHLYDKQLWAKFMEVGSFSDLQKLYKEINLFLSGYASGSRHQTISNCIGIFNRLSEECIDPKEFRKKTRDINIKRVLDFYALYLDSLESRGVFGSVDLSLLQQQALTTVQQKETSTSVFKHIIIDEYQDTNTVQERIFFHLAGGMKNICIVGDDDQALYRFRGATVENLVEFPNRCKQYLGVEPRRIDLNLNFRSEKEIVSFYSSFIDRINWKKNKKDGFYRVQGKKIEPSRTDNSPSVVASSAAKPEKVYKEIASLVKSLIDGKKVEDPNQIAFLFPAMKPSSNRINARVDGFKRALEAQGLVVYAPRAGRFLDQREAQQVFGLFLLIFGKPEISEEFSQGLREYTSWLSTCIDEAKAIVKDDKQLEEFIKDKRLEIESLADDYERLIKFTTRKKIILISPFTLELRREFAAVAGLSERAKKSLSNRYFERIILKREQEKKPFSVGYIINRTTSLDWSVLDLFYQLNGFKNFRKMYELAEVGADEGPVCNLGIITQYLARFMDQYTPMITADFLHDEKFHRALFLSFVHALYRRQESEYEDVDDPFPKGRIPFLTIHQAKGLEFPVVVLGTPFRKRHGVSVVEECVRALTKQEGEPLNRINEFDMMRMFYVALSRAMNLLVIPHFKGTGQQITEPFKTILNKEKIRRIPALDISSIPAVKLDKENLGKNYSYTGDFLLYKKCPRQYLIFKKFDFVPSRSQTMFFGSLVHQTIEDLHYHLIESRQRVAS